MSPLSRKVGWEVRSPGWFWRRRTLADVLRRRIDEGPDSDVDWLTALDVEIDVQNLEQAFERDQDEP